MVNLDPANDALPYKCDVDISELITLDDVMQEYGLGPNGGLVYCMEYLEKNVDWLLKRLAEFKDHYIIFDCPGQAEIFTHYGSFKNVLLTLQKNNYRLCVVHLVDAHLCTDASKYIAALMLSLKTMIQLELPHLNVLSKIDLIQTYGKLAFNLDYYTEVQDLSYILNELESQDKFSKRLSKLNKALCELIEEFSLIGFHTLQIEDKESVLSLCQHIDKANGYVFGYNEDTDLSVFASVAAAQEGYYRNLADIQERYVADFDEDREIVTEEDADEEDEDMTVN
ncbi:GPN-loop GTPase 2 [Chytridiales sp. JEL 0842]|nr:GPN-loop GTPase 2 [Chytridiales sp. JEL 0842]